MSSLKVFPASVPSCSGSGRKRRNESESDTGIKIPRNENTFYFVLESESDIPSSEDETESILSLQNKSTDFAKDTSDTSSKTSRYASDFEVEFEVVSLSEQEVKVPFDSSSSGTDMETWRNRQFEQSLSDNSEQSVWADNSSMDCGDELGEGNKLPARVRPCLKCKAPTNVHYCQQCYKVKKDFFPPRPKVSKKKKQIRPFLRRKGLDRMVKRNDEKVESGIESGSSQEVQLSPEAKVCGPVGNEGMCNVCFKNPKDGAFIHCRWVHIYSCYECSVKIWFTSKCCPLCNGRVNKVLKVAMG